MLRRCTLSAMAVTACWILHALPASADSTCVTLKRGAGSTVEDTLLTAGHPDWVTGSESSLWTGQPDGYEHLSLLQFDLGSLPPGVVVTSADLALTVSWNAINTDVDVHQLLSPWSEASTTYGSYANAANWVSAPLSSFGAGGYGQKHVDLTAMVSMWASGAAPNHGIMLRESAGYHAFWSSEVSSFSNRPALTVCYETDVCAAQPCLNGGVCIPQVGGYTCNCPAGYPGDNCEPACGDGALVAGEACDDANTAAGDGCSSTCVVEAGFSCSGSPSVCQAACGDGTLAGGEACDDGNGAAGDGCSAACVVEAGFSCSGSPSACTTACGDALIAGSEGCDDGNGLAGDGCSPACGVEVGFSCSGSPSSCSTACGDGFVAGTEGCDDGNSASGDGCSAACVVDVGFSCSGSPSICTTACGDGLVAGSEGCDDGNWLAGDGCSTACVVDVGFSCSGSPSNCNTTCGDGLVAGGEGCDDSNGAAGDGCSAACAVEAGFSCSGSPSACNATCGDGLVAGGEACDDGNWFAGDGCSAACAVEVGFSCSGSPSACSTTCGDGLVAGSEGCDDGNGVAGDGCSAACAVESGFSCSGVPSVCQCANGSSCNDGNPCTQNDVCSAGTCAGAPVSCAAPGVCQLAATCNSASGQCEYPSKPDNNACAVDSVCLNGQCTASTLTATVLDAKGDGIPGATVRVGTKNKLSTASGEAILQGIPFGTVVAKVDAEGYATAATQVEITPGIDTNITVYLALKGETVPFEVTAGVDAVKNDIRVLIPANGVVNPVTNLPITGVVELTVAPVDPTKQIELSPGPLVGQPQGGGAEVSLSSVFMADITLRQGNKEVQLAPGATAMIELPIPDLMQADLSPGDQIPAWWFDTTQGIWVEEGTGTVQPSSADPAKLAWVAQVSHFTWWNADYPRLYGDCVNVTVITADTQVPIPGAALTFTSIANNFRLSSLNTGPNGLACARLPNQDAIRVSAKHSQYPNISGGIPTVVTNTAGTILCGNPACKTLTIEMGRETCLSGTVQGEFDSLLDNVNVVARYDSGSGPRTSSTVTDVNGEYCVSAPMNTAVTVQAIYDSNGSGSAGGLKTDEVTVAQSGSVELVCDNDWVSGGPSSCTDVDTAADVLKPTCDATCPTSAAGFGDAGQQYSTGAAMDASGNMYVVGNFSGTLQGISGSPVSTGLDDVFVVKYDPTGNLLWVKTFGDSAGVGIQQANAVALDSLGNPVLVGVFTNTANFGTEPPLTSTGQYDGFIVKLDAVTGAVAQARQIKGQGAQWPTDIAVDNSNSQYPDTLVISGWFNNQIECGNSVFCPSAGGDDIFVEKIYGNSFYVGVERFGGVGDDRAYALDVDGAGNIALSGDFAASFSFAGEPLANMGGTDAFVAKFAWSKNANGGQPSLFWARRYGLNGGQKATGVVFDRSSGATGNAWVIGDFDGSMVINGVPHSVAGAIGTTDTFVIRVDSAGNDGVSDIVNNSNWQHGTDIALDTDGGLLIAGTTRGTVFFDGIQSTSVGQEDLYVAKVTTAGAYVWVSRYGGTPTSYVNNPSIAVRPFDPNPMGPLAGDIVVTGSIVGQIDFDGNAGIGVASNGGNDVFIAKLLSAE